MVKISIASVSFVLFVGQCWTGACHFNERWNAKQPDFNKYFDAQKSALDWDGILKPLHLEISLFSPRVPISLEAILSVLLLLGMIVGLNLRKVYPIFSVFAWTIPSIVAASGIAQGLAINVAQAWKVVELESILGAKISYTEFSSPRRRRKRR